MSFPDKARWFWLQQAFALAFAAWASFALAAALGVGPAFWAAVPAWVAAPAAGRPARFALAFRTLGTLAGLCLGLAALALPGGAAVHGIALALLLGLAIACRSLAHGALRQCFIFAGVAVAVMLVPALGTGGELLPAALARAAALLIGVVTAGAVLALCLPAALGVAASERFLALGGRALRLAEAMFAAHPPSRSQLGRFLAELARLEGRTGRASGADRLRVNCLEILASARELATAGLQPPAALGGARATSGRTVAPADHPALLRLSHAYVELSGAAQALASGPERPRQEWGWQRPENLRVVFGRLGLSAAACLVGALLLWLLALPGLEWAALALCVLALAPLRPLQPWAQGLLPAAAIGAGLGLLFRLQAEPGWLLVSVLPFLAAAALLRTHPHFAEQSIDPNLPFWLAAQASLSAAPAGAGAAADALALIAAAAFAGSLLGMLPGLKQAALRQELALLRRQLLHLVRSGAGSRGAPRRAGLRRLGLHLLRTPVLARRRPEALLECLNLAHALLAVEQGAPSRRRLLAAYLNAQEPLPAVLHQLQGEADAGLRRALQGAAPLLDAAS